MTTTTPKTTWFYYGRIKRNILTGFKANRRFSDTWDYRDGNTLVPAACVCIKYNPDTNTYSRGIAICSVKDNFTKRLARVKAEAAISRRIPTVKDGPVYKVLAPVFSDYLDYVLSEIEDFSGAQFMEKAPDGKHKVYAKAAYGLSKDELSAFEQRIIEG